MFSIGAYVVFWSLIVNSPVSQSVGGREDSVPVMNLVESSLLYIPVSTFPIDF